MALDVKGIKALEKQISSSLKHVNDLVQLIASLAEGPLDLRLASLHALRRIFTIFCREGKLNAGLLSEGSSTKRMRAEGAGPDAAAVLAGWLRKQFFTFLECLVFILSTPESELAAAEEKSSSGGGSSKARKGKKGGEADEEGQEQQQQPDPLSFRLAAMRTFGHFLAHSVPLAQQKEEGGQRFGFDVLLLLMRHVLAAGAFLQQQQGGSEGEDAASADGAATASSSSSSSSTGSKARAEALLSSFAAFRIELADDYDDVRLYCYKALAVLAKAKANAVEAGEGSAAAGAGDKKKKKGGSSSSSSSSSPSSEAADAASSAAFVSADAGGVGAAGLDLLLSITLPPLEQDWEETEHKSWLEEQLGSLLPAGTYKPFLSKAQAREMLEGEEKGEEEEPVFGAEDSEEEGKGRLSGKKRRAEGSSTSVATLIAGGPRYFSLLETRRAYADALLSILRLPLPQSAHRKALLALPYKLLPQLPDRYPLLLSDFLSSCYSAGGASAVLALESLFLLMQTKGLEYPRFYSQLYAIITQGTLHAKYRARFFTQLDLFMGSVALPAYLVAAVLKRVARLALTASAPVALFCLAFLFNLFKRHPACYPLLHRTREASAAGAAAAEGSGKKEGEAAAAAPSSWPLSADPFDAETDDPAAANALQSSLWELQALQQHYYPPVAYLARLFLKPISQELNKEEFDLGHAQAEHVGAVFSGLLQQEMKRSTKKGGVSKLADVPFAFQLHAEGFHFHYLQQQVKEQLVAAARGAAGAEAAVAAAAASSAFTAAVDWEC